MKAERDCVKIKLRRDPTSEKSDLYEFKMALFDNGETEEFLLFLQNFKMTLEASVTLVARKTRQYLCTLLRVTRYASLILCVLRQGVRAQKI